MQTNAHNYSKALQQSVEFCSLPLVDGPVTVGMSLDIASIDTISEINMVRRVHATCSPAGAALIGAINEA